MTSLLKMGEFVIPNKLNQIIRAESKQIYVRYTSVAIDIRCFILGYRYPNPFLLDRGYCKRQEIWHLYASMLAIDT